MPLSTAAPFRSPPALTRPHGRPRLHPLLGQGLERKGLLPRGSDRLMHKVTTRISLLLGSVVLLGCVSKVEEGFSCDFPDPWVNRI